jgi:hypothetical protein
LHYQLRECINKPHGIYQLPKLHDNEEFVFCLCCENRRFYFADHKDKLIDSLLNNLMFHSYFMHTPQQLKTANISKVVLEREIRHIFDTIIKSEAYEYMRGHVFRVNEHLDFMMCLKNLPMMEIFPKLAGEMTQWFHFHAKAVGTHDDGKCYDFTFEHTRNDLKWDDFAFNTYSNDRLQFHPLEIEAPTD